MSDAPDAFGPRPRSAGASGFAMPRGEAMPPGDFIAVGADLAPATLLDGYRAGLFAMPEAGGLGWWSPDPRGVLPPSQVHVSRSLGRSLRRFEVSVDRCFSRIVALCADPARPHGWINLEYAGAYLALHELGWAHSLEVWLDGRLAGGLFGVEVGGVFAAESKVHLATDASKAAVVALAELLNDGQPRIIDVQWSTAHLASLGVVEISRAAYLGFIAGAVRVPPRFGGALPSGPDSRIRWVQD